jgi:hypothetical protein
MWVTPKKAPLAPRRDLRLFDTRRFRSPKASSPTRLLAGERSIKKGHSSRVQRGEEALFARPGAFHQAKAASLAAHAPAPVTGPAPSSRADAAASSASALPLPPPPRRLTDPRPPRRRAIDHRQNRARRVYTHCDRLARYSAAVATT